MVQCGIFPDGGTDSGNMEGKTRRKKYLRAESALFIDLMAAEDPVTDQRTQNRCGSVYRHCHVRPFDYKRAQTVRGI